MAGDGRSELHPWRGRAKKQGAVTGGLLLEGSGRGSAGGGSGQLVLCLPKGRDGVGERR